MQLKILFAILQPQDGPSQRLLWLQLLIQALLAAFGLLRTQ